jgi:hypothetical protein
MELRNRKYAEPSVNEAAAPKRVQGTPAMKIHAQTVMYDCAYWEDHMNWAATVTVAEIVSWAEAIERAEGGLHRRYM